MGQEIQLKLNNNNVSPVVEKVGDGSLQGFTATDLTGAANELKNTLNSKADQDDLASINLTGTTNTTGSQINRGTFFYLNGALVKALTNIADGATFTSGTNYETVTAGGLNAIRNDLRSFARIYYDYSVDTKTHTVNIGRSFAGVAFIQCWDGTASNSGLYLVRANSSGGSVTPIKAADRTTITQSGFTVTIAVNSQWTSVIIYETAVS